jgi:hypothetical protein
VSTHTIRRDDAARRAASLAHHHRPPSCWLTRQQTTNHHPIVINTSRSARCRSTFHVCAQPAGNVVLQQLVGGWEKHAARRRCSTAPQPCGVACANLQRHARTRRARARAARARRPPCVWYLRTRAHVVATCWQLPSWRSSTCAQQHAPKCAPRTASVLLWKPTRTTISLEVRGAAGCAGVCGAGGVLVGLRWEGLR